MTTRDLIPQETDENRRQWQLSFDMTSHGIALIDPESNRIRRVNPAFAAMHGGIPGDFVGEPIAETLGPSWRPRVPELVRTVHEQGYLRFKCDRSRLDGSTFPADVEVVAARDDRGGLLYRLAFVTDLTELVAAERERASALRLFATAVDQAPIGMCLVGLDGHLLRVNTALCRLLGRTKEELLTSDLQQLTHPHDLEADLTLLHECLTGTRDAYELPMRYLRPDGGTVHALLSVSLIRTETGEPQHFVSQVMDLTQLHVAERQLRLVEERDRIAGELHDTTIQRLFAVGLTLQRAAGDAQDPAQARRLEAAIEEIDDTIASIRTAIYGLRPSAMALR